MKKPISLSAALILSTQIVLSQPILPFIGNGTIGYSGDGGQAINAQVNYVSTFCGNNSGDIFVSDFGNNNIRKVNSSGIISTIAGNQIASFSGDGGVATNASLNFTGFASIDFQNADIALDASGNLYINDFANFRIRKVTPLGIISTIAGNGFGGYTGDGGPAIAAKIRAKNLAVDATGNVYISDDSSHVVRKINTSGVITTIAGNGSAGYSGDGSNGTLAKLNTPRHLAVDGSGNVFVSDVNNNRIRKINTSTGIISTYCGNGIASYTGDGGLASLAAIAPGALAISPLTGDLVFVSYSMPSNFSTSKVNMRSVNSSGIINTVRDSSFFYMSGNQYVQQIPSFYLDNTLNMYFSPNYNICVGFCSPGNCYKMSLAPQSSTGIEVLDFSNSLVSVYPMPSNGKFTLETKFSEISTYQIFDMNGHEISNGFIFNSKINVDLSSISSGNYSLIISNNGLQIKKNIVISR